MSRSMGSCTAYRALVNFTPNGGAFKMDRIEQINVTNGIVY